MIAIFGAEPMDVCMSFFIKKETMMDYTDANMEVRFEANLVKITRVDGDEDTVKRGNGAGGPTLQICYVDDAPRSPPTRGHSLA